MPYRQFLLGNVLFQVMLLLFLTSFPIDHFLESTIAWLTAYKMPLALAGIHIMGYSACAFWPGAFLIILRRPRRPTRCDLFYLRFGMPIILLLDFVIFPWVWYLKDV